MVLDPEWPSENKLFLTCLDIFKYRNYNYYFVVTTSIVRKTINYLLD
jgi:hypothetical protein